MPPAHATFLDEAYNIYLANSRSHKFVNQSIFNAQEYVVPKNKNSKHFFNCLCLMHVGETVSPLPNLKMKFGIFISDTIKSTGNGWKIVHLTLDLGSTG